MHESTQISRGEGTVTVIFNTASTTEISPPAIRAGDYKQLVDSCFTAKELSYIDEGSNAEVSFTFVMSDEIPSSEISSQYEIAIANIEKEIGKVSEGVFFDARSTKAIGDSDSSVDSLKEPVEILFDVPLYLRKENREYYVLANNKGVCTLLNDIDKEADTITIEANSIANCLILYQDGVPKSESTSKFQITSSHLFIVSILILVGTWFFVDRVHSRI